MIKYIICLFFVIYFGLSGCSDASPQISTSLIEESTTGESAAEESAASVQASPFDVKIDTGSLELNMVKETRVFIFTELTEWSYTVQADYGKISEINSDSFVYTRPKDEEQKEDVITIDLLDYENKVHHKMVIPLNYSFDPEAIVPGA